MSVTSLDIERHLRDYVPDISPQNALLVFGYIRQQATDQLNLQIPTPLIEYCLLYTFMLTEWWSKPHNHHKLRIDNDFTVYGDRNKNGWQNAFGTISAPPNSGIYEWTFKIISDPSDEYSRLIIIGLIPTEIVDGLNSLNCYGWFLGRRFGGGVGLYLSQGQLYRGMDNTPFINPYFCRAKEMLIIMNLDTNKRELKYVINGHDAGTAIKASERYGLQHEPYSIAVSMLRDCALEIVSFRKYIE